MMRAVYFNEYGSPDKLIYGELPNPYSGSRSTPLNMATTLEPNSVVIQMIYAGVNFIDIYFRKGVYPVPSFPFVPGKEGIGRIVALGDEVLDFLVGDTVLFLMGGTGSYAEEVVVESKYLIKLPLGIDLKVALGAGLQAMTAHYLVHDSYPVKSGDTVLIHAASGGVGLILIQLAKIKGARIIATVSSEKKKEKALQFGADQVILYHDYQFETAVMEWTSGMGVNVVYDSVGQATFEAGLKVLQARGTMVSYGQSSGKVPPFDLAQLNREGSLFLTRPSLVHFILNREELESRARDIFSLIREDQLKVQLGGTYALSEANLAQKDLESRKTMGKLILQI